MSTPTTDDLQRIFLQLQIDRLQREDDERAAAKKKQADDAAETAKKESSDKAEKEAAERAARAADLNAAAAGLGKLTGSSVTFPEKSVFREHVASAAALRSAAKLVAATIKATAAERTQKVLLTGRTDQLDTLHAAYAFDQALDGLQAQAVKALLPAERGAGIEAQTEGESPAPGSVLEAAVAAAVSLFDLLSVETTISASSRVASELETHVAVLQELLRTGVANDPPQTVVHETIGIPSATSELRGKFETLKQQIHLLDGYVAELEAEIAALEATPDPDRLALLKAAREFASKTSTQINDFVARALKVDDTSKLSAFQGALAAERLTAGGADSVKFVAVVSPARIAADQVALKRRIFAPRVVVTASTTVDVIVLNVETGELKAAASHTGEDSFQVRFPMAWSKDSAALRPTLDPLGGIFAAPS